MMKPTFAALLALLSVAVSPGKADDSTLSARTFVTNHFEFSTPFCFCSLWKTDRQGENWIEGFKRDNCVGWDPKGQQWWCQLSTGGLKAVDGTERDLCHCDKNRMDLVYGGACSNGGEAWCKKAGSWNGHQGYFCRQRESGN